MLRHFTPQRLLIGTLVLGFAFAAARIFALQGLIRPVRVVSGSMVERLLGEHFVVTCADCGFVFPFGVESPPPTEGAVCPNCGFSWNATIAAQRERGNRVLIDRAAYWLDHPKRFDLVAFRDPRQPARLVVKRVIGLPGEKLAIRRGDVYIDGRILRKSLAEYRRLAQFVHDNNYSPSPKNALPNRWRSDNDDTWEVDGKGFRFVPPGQVTESIASSDFQWLAYHHWRCFANPLPRSAEAPVADNYGYNQGESRGLQETADLVLSCRAVLGGDGEMALRIHDGREWFMVVLNVKQRNARLLRGDVELTTVPLPAELKLDPLPIEFGLVDRQVVLALGRQELLRHAYEPSDSTFKPTSNPLAIGGRDSEIRIFDIRISRDTYYLDPWSVGQVWNAPSPLGADEYLVLGDNPPISDDGRKWEKPFLSSRSILGRVTKWNVD